MTIVGEAVAREMKAQGITTVFGLIGDDILELAVELERAGLRYFSTRHEASAVGMADGYARATGELTAALVSRGPGMTNAVTAMATCARARSPVVILAGDSDQKDRGSIYTKYVDQQKIYEGAGVDYVNLDDPETVTADFAAVCERARHGLTIVASFPGTILMQTAGTKPSKAVLPVLAAAGDPDPEMISMVADLLQESWAVQRPIILAGRGAVRADAGAELERLGELCGALLGTSLMGRSLFVGAKYNIGVCGTFAEDPAVELAQQADTIIAFGSSLDMFTTVGGEMFPKARFIRFDTDPNGADKGSVPADLYIRCDIRRGAAALADELERRGHTSTGFRDADTADKIASYKRRPAPNEGTPVDLH